MNKLFWYVLGKFSQNFLLCLIAVLTIYLVVDFFEKLRKFLKYDAELSLVFSFFLYRIPEITFLLAPLGALMAAILTVGGMNRTREITAMRSCGLSFFQIASPFLALSVLISAIGFSLTAIVIPLTNLRADYVESVLIQHKPEALISSPNSLWLRIGQRELVQIERVNQQGNDLEGFHRFRMDEPFHLAEIVEAGKGSYMNGDWKMEGVVQRNILAHGVVSIRQHPVLYLPLPLTPNDIRSWISQDPQNMTLYRLKEYIERMTQDGHNPQRYLTGYWARVAYAVVPFVMTLLGVAMSLRGSGMRRAGVAKGIGQTLAIGFLFWAAHSVGVVLGQNGAVLPIVGSWIATVMFLLVGANLFLKLK